MSLNFFKIISDKNFKFKRATTKINKNIYIFNNENKYYANKISKQNQKYLEFYQNNIICV